jgi:hypothetical protein
VNFGPFFGVLAAAFLMALWVAILARQDLKGESRPWGRSRTVSLGGLKDEQPEVGPKGEASGAMQVKDCRKAAPKEELVGKTSESKNRPHAPLLHRLRAQLQPRPRHHPHHAVSVCLRLHHAHHLGPSQRRKVVDRWRMADGGWRMADGGWRMADGGWRMAGRGAAENGGLIGASRQKIKIKAS